MQKNQNVKSLERAISYLSHIHLAPDVAKSDGVPTVD